MISRDWAERSGGAFVQRPVPRGMNLPVWEIVWPGGWADGLVLEAPDGDAAVAYVIEEVREFDPYPGATDVSKIDYRDCPWGAPENLHHDR